LGAGGWAAVGSVSRTQSANSDRIRELIAVSRCYGTSTEETKIVYGEVILRLGK
jgi:hypothetical protein